MNDLGASACEVTVSRNILLALNIPGDEGNLFQVGRHKIAIHVSAPIGHFLHQIFPVHRPTKFRAGGLKQAWTFQKEA
jgi:hypothetical protein